MLLEVMAELREVSGPRKCVLLPEHLVGRSPQCALRLDRSYVSAQHALLRWQGRHWEVLDRGSRNGTRLDGSLLTAGQPYALHLGAVLTFGHAEERWALSDVEPPIVMVVALDTGEVLLGNVGIVGVPSSNDAACTVFLDIDGQWKLETPEADARLLEDGHIFEARGRRFRFCRPTASDSTAAISGNPQASPVLHFAVSADEEFVELQLENAIGVSNLGARSHNYLLLVLARAYLADVAAGVAAESSGWLDKDALAESLRITAPQVDGEVFRIRKHFAQRGLLESATIIERRARTRQLRIGIQDLRVRRI